MEGKKTMKGMTGKKIIAVLLVLMMSVSMLTGFTYQNGFGTVYYQSYEDIFDGVTYSELIGNHPTNGVEHAFTVETDLNDSDVEAMVYNGEVTGRYTLSNMIKYAQEQGYKVLAAINGDIFDTSSGTPKNPVIHQGYLVTSGYQQDRVVAFDSDGKASMKYASISYGLKGTIAYTQPVETVTTSAAVDGTVVETPVTNDTTITQETNTKIDFFNVPFGAAHGLHLYNRHYASSTRTSGTNVEVIIDCNTDGGFQLKVNDSIKGIVNSVNSATCNTPISENQVVLSTIAGSASSGILSCLVPGSEIEISVTDNNTGNSNCLEDVQEALGLYYSLVENGRNVTSGTTLNPHTAVGIKSDGSLIMYEVDGRQASNSKGLSLTDLANHMISLGCVSAFNLDGGGSSVMYSRLPGLEDTATLKSTPSGGSERAVSNALLLVYKGSGNNTAENLHVYPSLALLMPGADVQLSTYASNELYEKATLPGKIEYSVDSSYGTVSSNGLFTAGTKTGRVEIDVSSDDLKGKTEVEVVSDITIVPSVQKVYLEANQQVDINIAAKAGTLTVNSKDNLFTWTCDENIGTIDTNGIFVAGSKSAQQGNIYVSFGTITTTIPVQVGALSVDFSDTYGHWAKDYIGSLAARGLVNGIGDNMFAPDANVTRAEFLAMLAKSVYDLDVSKSQPAGFTDVPATEWYYNYVNWGYENGIVSGTGENQFAPTDPITREQMTVMICNFARSLGFQLPQIGTGIAFTDQASISSWAIDYVATVANAGIINGQPEGDFQPQGIATRAQAAKVMFVFCNIKDNITN